MVSPKNNIEAIISDLMQQTLRKITSSAPQNAYRILSPNKMAQSIGVTRLDWGRKIFINYQMAVAIVQDVAPVGIQVIEGS